MREIKFEFVGLNIKFNEIIRNVYTLDELVNGSGMSTFFHPMNENCKLLAKRQYTGLKDKNGVEIYEGDIVLYTDDNGREWMGPLAKPMVIEFYEGAFQSVQNGAAYFQGGDIPKKGYAAQAQVIGNIYENKDFLEAQS